MLLILLGGYGLWMDPAFCFSLLHPVDVAEAPVLTASYLCHFSSIPELLPQAPGAGWTEIGVSLTIFPGRRRLYRLD